MDMVSGTTVMMIAGGEVAAVVKVAKVVRVAKVLANLARDLANLARDLANLARDLASLARDLEADLGGAQSLMMTIGATSITAAIAGGEAAALASPARGEDDKKYDVPTCVRRQSRGNKGPTFDYILGYAVCVRQCCC
jgi:hypothetical protein